MNPIFSYTCNFAYIRNGAVCHCQHKIENNDPEKHFKDMLRHITAHIKGKGFVCLN